MKNWNDYKEYVKSNSPNFSEDISEIEDLAQIISKVIEQRHELGLSQRDLAKLCNIPQSSVARIESLKTTPNLTTLLKILKQLNLKLIITK